MTEISQLNGIKRRAFFKRAARRLLCSNWLSQILVFVVLGSCFVGINQFGCSLGSVLFRITENTYVASLYISVCFVLSVTLVIPLVYGLVSFEIKVVNGTTDFSELFCAFASFDTLNRAYTLFTYTFCRIILFFVPAIAVGVFMNFEYYNGVFGFEAEFYGVDAVRFALSCMFIVLLYFGFFLSSRSFVAVYVSIVRRDLPLRESFFVARNCVHIGRNEVFSLSLSFIPLVVVSIFTFGLLFIMYTLPYMILTFTMFSKYLYDVEMADKTVSHLMYKEIESNED